MSGGGGVADVRATVPRLRAGIVLTMGRHGGRISSRELAKELGQALGAVDHHVRRLLELGTIVPVHHIGSILGDDRSFYRLDPASATALARATAGGGGGPAELHRALRHSLRVAILIELTVADEPLSPRQLADRLAAPLGSTSYHMRYLQRFGYVELTHTTPVRGALAHYYALPAALRDLMSSASS